MTRKDYEKIAGALAVCVKGQAQYGPFAAGAVQACALQIADTLATDNPRFNRARFLEACGVKS